MGNFLCVHGLISILCSNLSDRHFLWALVLWDPVKLLYKGSMEIEQVSYWIINIRSSFNHNNYYPQNDS